VSDPRDDEQYESPAIDEREPIETPLVAVTSGEPTISAAFHPADDGADTYEPPAIAERDEIGTALIGFASGEPASASFHPPEAYEPPAIVERDEIDTPLVAFGSGTGPCLAVH
jgi:hypothetical protein